MGAPMVARGNVSSDSSSDDGVALGTIPYVAYLCGYRHTISPCPEDLSSSPTHRRSKPGKRGKSGNGVKSLW